MNDLQTFGEKSHDNHHQIINNIAKGKEHFIVAGLHLLESKNAGYWTSYADTWEEYLAMPGLEMRTSTAYNYMRVAEEYYLKMQIPVDKLGPCGSTKLNMLLESNRVDNQNINEWLSALPNMTKRDLKTDLGTSPAEDNRIGAEIRHDSRGTYLFLYDPIEGTEPGAYRLERDDYPDSGYQKVIKLTGYLR